MGIKFLCPNGHKLHVKSFLASQRGVCPQCGEKFIVPAQSLPDIRVESLGVKSSKRASVTQPVAAVPQATAGKQAVAQKVAAKKIAAEPAAEIVEIEVAAEPAAASGESRKTRSPFADLLDSAPISPAANQPQPAVANAPHVGGADILNQAPAALWYVRIGSGEQFGPAQADMMQRWLGEGRITADSLVWREGWAEWEVAARVFPQLAQPQLPPLEPGSIAAFEQGLEEHVEQLVVAPQIDLEAVEASPAGLVESRSRTPLGIGQQRKSKFNSRLAMIGLLVAILCLIPLFLYVLFR